VLASSLDRDVESHVRLSRLVIERCKRLAERGQDVLLLVEKFESNRQFIEMITRQAARVA
jgi:transcription termination factor Rho